MSLWAKRSCIACGDKRPFSKMSKRRVCTQCQTALRNELDSLMRELPRMEHRFQRLKTPAKQKALATDMITRLERVMAIEELGIYSQVETEVLLPSQWVTQYQNEHDWACVHTVS